MIGRLDYVSGDGNGHAKWPGSGGWAKIDGYVWDMVHN